MMNFAMNNFDEPYQNICKTPEQQEAYILITN